MTSVLRVATLTGAADAEAAIAGALSTDSGVELVLRCVDRVELLALIRSRSVDLLISVGAPHWFDLQAADEAISNEIGLVGYSDDPLDREQLLHLGVRLASGPTVAELLAASEETPGIAPRRLTSLASVPQGKVIAVWGPKGAPGRTTVAIEASVLLSRTDPDTLIVDADTYGGDVLQVLGVVEELATVVWAARLASREELDPNQLTSALRRASPDGPVVLPGIPRSELSAEISDYGWRKLLDTLRTTFTFVVCDVSFSLESAPAAAGRTDSRNHVVRTTLKEAEHVVAVCRADPVGIKNFLWAYEDLRRLVDIDNVSVVVNRLQPGDEREVADILKRHLGKRPVAYLPDRPAEFGAAVKSGRSVCEQRPDSDVGRALDGLIARLGGSARRRGFLTKIGGRS